MRTLLLFRGSPGCGKSTFIEQHGLKEYALSADDLRMLYQSTVLKANGDTCIGFSSESRVWQTLFQILESRMKRGEFTVIDATNSKTSEINRYKSLAKQYRYRIFIVDMTTVPIKEAKIRNKSRDCYKIVPEDVIDNMYSRFNTQSIPSGITVINPMQSATAVEDTIYYKPIDLSHYKKVHHIGDVHGCYTVLKKYLDENSEIKDDEFYIFCGDYIDRGIENAEVVNYLLSIMNNKNVLLLEGNHERHLKKWSRDQKATSKQFENYTRIQLEDACVSKKDVSKLCRKLAQCAYYTYQDKTVIVTHGGLSGFKDNLLFISTEQMIEGVGSYNDYVEVANTFSSRLPNMYQVNGHRNVDDLPIKVNSNCFNLEGQVEFGGSLRCLQLDCNGFNPIETQNEVFKIPDYALNKVAVDNNTSVEDFIKLLRANKSIKEKQFGNISSFNFTREAFRRKLWEDQTIKARGLFINTVTNKIVARSYEKFFNIGEMEHSTIGIIKKTFEFPVKAYQKYNGYLGIVGYDSESGELIVSSKSTYVGNYAIRFKNILYNKLGENGIEKLSELLKKNEISLVFEVIDPVNDPHIIKYEKENVVLLDIILNNIEFNKYPYEKVESIAKYLNIDVKKLEKEFDNFEQFIGWYSNIVKDSYVYNQETNEQIEGYVIEDSNNKMVKIKLHFYSFWKHMRSVAESTIKNGYIKNTGMLTNKLSNDFYGFVRELVNQNKDVPNDITKLRDLYYQNKREKGE